MAGLVRSTEPFRFLSHRALRIYPIFFLLVACSFVVSRLLGSPFSFDLLAMTLAPVGLRSFSLGGIEWTLVFEVSYYTALFSLACARLQRHLNLVATVWIGAIMASALLIPSLGNELYLPAHLLFLAPANLAFAGGLLLPSAIARGYLPRASALLIIPVALSYDYVDLGTSRMLSGVLPLPRRLGRSIRTVAEIPRKQAPPPARRVELRTLSLPCSDPPDGRLPMASTGSRHEPADGRPRSHLRTAGLFRPARPGALPQTPGHGRSVPARAPFGSRWAPSWPRSSGWRCTGAQVFHILDRIQDGRIQSTLESTRSKSPNNSRSRGRSHQ